MSVRLKPWRPPSRGRLPEDWHPAKSQKNVYCRSDRAVLQLEILEVEDRRWIHAWVWFERHGAHRRIPSHRDLCEIKEVFIGRERPAVQLFLRAYDGKHDGVLHLFAPEDGDLSQLHPLVDVSIAAGDREYSEARRG